MEPKFMKVLSILILWCLMCGAAKDESKEHYCNINEEHTMCQYTGFNSMKLKCRNYKEKPLHIVQPFLLIWHNEMRDSYANGHNGFTVPNMMGLIWDDELQRIASRWAMQCPWYEDDFRDVDRFRVANLVVTKIHELNYPFMATLWADLLSQQINGNFHELTKNGELKSSFSPTKPLSMLTNPYFRFVGCVQATVLQEINGTEYHKAIMVCNYGPLDMPYNEFQPKGPPCSACPSGTSCLADAPYKFLCYDKSEKISFIEHNNNSMLHPTSDIDPKENRTTPICHIRGGNERESMSNNATDIVNRADVETYCKIVCDNGEKHTLCTYRKPSEEFDEVIPLTGPEHEATVVALHNKLRNEVAGGSRTKPDLPMAANMREMQWDPELAKGALVWSMQCKHHRDQCRDIYLHPDDKVPTYVSQLISIDEWKDHKQLPTIKKPFIGHWVKGKDHITRENISPFTYPKTREQDYSDFAQLIWAESYKVGCGMTLCRNETNTKTVLVSVCNYAPGGLEEGKSIYLLGGACTACRKLYKRGVGGRYCSKEYIHLCSGTEVVRLFLGNFIIIVIIISIA